MALPPPPSQTFLPLPPVRGSSPPSFVGKSTFSVLPSTVWRDIRVTVLRSLKGRSMDTAADFCLAPESKARTGFAPGSSSM